MRKTHGFIIFTDNACFSVLKAFRIDRTLVGG